MRRVAVLGSTGSIGTQTLDVISRLPDRLQVVGLAAKSNEELLKQQTTTYKPLKSALYERTGMEGLREIATMPEADIVVVAVAGVIGLEPTIAAIKAGKHIALASKEVLVAAGEIVMPLAKKHNVEITPIDSEHSAIFQCLRGYEPKDIKRLILTASGGPFRGKTKDELTEVTKQQALNHPTWSMGGKITVDSATLMNKALETIEAKWLFGVEIDQVDVLLHPQSIIHSMVEMQDGSVLAQLGWPDMRLPIQIALLHPERVEGNLPPWNPLETKPLTFEPVDHETFPGITLARQAARERGTMPCAFNAANEEAANAFLREEVRFLQIAEIVEAAMAAHRSQPATLESLLEADATSRDFTRNLIRSLP